MNTVAFVLRAVQLARQAGLKVTFEPGWETRGNGYRGNFVGVIEHHTATPSSLANPFPTRRLLRDGRSNLSGPLCNSAGPADGTIHIMAAQAANHAGASGGRSMGPLPVTTLFNPRVWGHEIDYAGSVPMLPGQYRSAAIWARCLLLALVEVGQIPRFDIERVRAHAETSVTGKWDPGYAPGRTIDMAAFRRSARTILQEEDDMQLDDRVDWDKVNKLGPDYLGHKLLGTWQLAGMARAEAKAARAEIAGLRAAVDKLAGAVAGDDLTATELKAAVKSGVAEALAEGTVNVDIDITGPGGTNV